MDLAVRVSLGEDVTSGTIGGFDGACEGEMTSQDPAKNATTYNPHRTLLILPPVAASLPRHLGVALQSTATSLPFGKRDRQPLMGMNLDIVERGLFRSVGNSLDADLVAGAQR